MQNLDIAIIGGSVAGLGAAVALAQDGHRVTILEQDAAPLPASPGEAFERWERRGSPQTRHSHAFLARLHNLLRDRVPDLLEFLLANGAETMPFRDIAGAVMPDAEFLPEDDEITMLACRRITFEWALRRHIEGLAGARFRDGVEVAGLLAEPGSAPPRVRGVALGSGEKLDADLVVDATGRRTRIGRWLEDIGAKAPRVESEPCGIFYSSRFYRLRDGVAPPLMDGPMGADLGYLKYGIFPGDSRIFSITLAASPDDDPLRAVLKPEAFEAVARLLPATSAWVDPAVSEPISGVHGMSNLMDTRRFLIEDDEPLALGLTCVGDSLIHTNPITGRGCSLAWVAAFFTADAVRESADLRDAALAIGAAVEREIVPWYEAARMQDRDSIAVNQIQRRGEDPFETNNPDGSVDPRAYMRTVMRDGLLPAMAEDIVVLRAFMRIFNLLEAPSDLMANPAILTRILEVYNRTREGKGPKRDRGPSRDAMLAGLAKVAA